ncbi:MAG: hypothetical protein NT136_04135 [Candidatus Moranbacteria bacterium]|nr:hypothetical protein [Candidatus Moranbacteria bacterium]
MEGENSFIKPPEQKIGKGIMKCLKCGKEYGTVEDVPKGSISHGYCPECGKIVGEEGKKEIEKLKKELKC